MVCHWSCSLLALLRVCIAFAGSAVLVLTTTEVDKTGASYYGEQGLHYLSVKGEGNIVILGIAVKPAY